MECDGKIYLPDDGNLPVGTFLLLPLPSHGSLLSVQVSLAIHCFKALCPEYAFSLILLSPGCAPATFSCSAPFLFRSLTVKLTYRQ